MKGWMIGGLTGACIGVSIYLAMAKKDAPAPAKRPEVPAVAIQAAPSAPVVLPGVVEVTDLDPLLDPPAKSATGAPFDADPATVPVSIPAAPAPIPPAVD